MMRSRLLPLTGLVVLIGTVSAQEKKSALPVAPPPHHSLKGYVTVEKAIAADAKAFRATPQAAGYLGIAIRGDAQHRPVISAVESDSPADAAGFRAGDQLLKLDGVTLTSESEARDLLRARVAGESVSLVVERGTRELTLTATLVPTSQPRTVGPRAVMGINVTDATPKGSGAKVEAVTPDMPAAKSGVKVGDVITKVDGRDVSDPDTFRAQMSSRRPGDIIDLLLERAGKREGVRVTLAPEGGGGRTFTGFNNYWTKPHFKLAIIGVEYPDVKHNEKIKDKDWEASMFSAGTYIGKSATGQTVHGSMFDYYREQSYGKLAISGKFVGWVEMKKKRSESFSGNGTNKSEWIDFMNTATDLALEKYGKDSLKECDGIFFLYAGDRATTTRGNFYWPHKGDFQHKASNTRWPYFVVQEGTDRMTNISVFCHEFGHMLGLPDLYERPESPGSEGVGVWCAMANQQPNGKPQHFSAWCKEKLGWVKPKMIDPRVPQKIILGPIESDPTQCLKVMVRADGSEYFLLENRTKTGFDESLPAGGLLIWRVVQNKPILEESHGVDGPAGPRSFLDDVPYPSKSNNSFTPYTTPSSRSQLGGGLPVYITNIRRLPDNRITFQIGYEFQ
jgi:M6 family metalloprotease-like protein